MIRCREVWVHFAVSGKQTVRISRDETASCLELQVAMDEGNRLVIRYVNSSAQTLKTITYNFDHVLDFSCEGVVG